MQVTVRDVLQAKEPEFMTNELFEPLTLGNISRFNRIVFSPKMRACPTQPGGVPNTVMCDFNFGIVNVPERRNWRCSLT